MALQDVEFELHSGSGYANADIVGLYSMGWFTGIKNLFFIFREIELLFLQYSTKIS